MDDMIKKEVPMDSAVLESGVLALSRQYPFLECCSLGRSFQGKPIHALRFGQGEHKVLYVGAHHGMEWITSLILMCFLEECCKAYEVKGTAGLYDLPYLFETRSLYLVPMLNPDGVDMALSGREEQKKWQANARGVDLNHNYAAGWAKAKVLEPQYGIRGPGPTRYGGRRPESEPETAALCALCRAQCFSLALALHAQGEEIYYDYGDKTPRRSLAMAEIFSAVSGYQLSRPEGIAVGAGFKDWMIAELETPAFTVEVGKGENPLPLTSFEQTYAPCRELLFTAALV